MHIISDDLGACPSRRTSERSFSTCIGCHHPGLSCLCTRRTCILWKISKPKGRERPSRTRLMACPRETSLPWANTRAARSGARRCAVFSDPRACLSRLLFFCSQPVSLTCSAYLTGKGSPLKSQESLAWGAVSSRPERFLGARICSVSQTCHNKRHADSIRPGISAARPPSHVFVVCVSIAEICY